MGITLNKGNQQQQQQKHTSERVKSNIYTDNYFKMR